VDLAGVDEYRCFLWDPGFEQDRFITGYEVIPDDPARVHHVQIMVVNPSVEVEPGLTNGDLMRQFDEASPDRDGWSCFGLVGERVIIESFPVNWGAGQGVLNLPESSGSRVLAGSQFVLQVHYNLSDASQYGKPVSTEVRVRMADEVEREGFFAMPDGFIDTVFAGDPARLTPGMERVPFSYETQTDLFLDIFGVESFEVYGVLPHMHYHGRSFYYDIVDANGEVQCGVHIENWDPAWQIFYFYDQPLQLPPGSRIRTTCEFDTRGRTEPLSAGWGVDYEMCMTGLYLLPP
jgi:Copper type II ascorbate-dependent monooxygenase, C-terminal domain